MKNVYLPINNVSDYQCYVVQDKDTIRAYERVPSNNTTSGYTDFYINSNYLSRTGTQSWSNYSVLPTCMDNSLITTDYFYSVNFSDTLIIFFIIFIFTFYLAFRIFKRVLGRWFNV